MTGIPIPCSASSSSKHFGAAISSSAIAPKTGAIFFTSSAARVVTFKTDWERVNICEFFKEERFSFHDRYRCVSPDIS